SVSRYPRKRIGRRSTGARSSLGVWELEVFSIPLLGQADQEFAELVELFDDQLKPLGDPEQPSPNDFEHVLRVLTAFRLTALHEGSLQMTVLAQGRARMRIVQLPRDMVEFQAPDLLIAAPEASGVGEPSSSETLARYR